MKKKNEKVKDGIAKREGIRRAALVGVIGILMVSMLITMVVSATLLPTAFYGNVTVDGVDAPVGTVVTGRVVDAVSSPETTEDNVTVTEAGKYGGPGGWDPKIRIIPDNDADELKTIKFYIKRPTDAEEIEANETATVDQVTHHWFELTAISGLVLPNITDWYNNKTKDSATEVAINESECVYFNATADQVINYWRWYNDSALEQNSTSNEFTASWAANGTYTVSVDATNENGTSAPVNWMVTVKEKKPDLIVTGITPKCGYLFANESNNITATIKNNGTADAGAFNVSFDIAGVVKKERVSGLAVGASKEVTVTDTTERNAGDLVTINVTADCDGEVGELNETNNVMNITKTVVNNGYKGKRYTGGEDINTWKTFELNGSVLYSLGDSYYASGGGGWTHFNVTWTASDLPVPGAATIEEARLYVPYCWAKDGAMPNNYTMTFNGNPETFDVHYWDTKWYDRTYPYYGMLAYNVTDNFSTSGNVANFTSLWSGLPTHSGASMRGMLLVVVYADDSEPQRQIFVNEEFDMLYGGSSKCTTPAEATAYAPFAGIDDPVNKSARLITVAPGAGYPYYPDEGELIFNGHIWYNVWNETNAYGAQIGIDDRDVTEYLNETMNEAGFQSSEDWMEASNAILVVETKPAVALYITSPENRTYASICVRLNFTVEPEGTALDWIGYSLDGGANVTIAGNTTVSESSADGHNIVVYANDTSGNMVASNTVFFTIHPGDIDFSGEVYLSDLLLLAQAYNSKPGDGNWNPDADLNCDDRVYTGDLLLLAQNYNKEY